MIPFSPTNNDFERVIENLERGLPETGAPAAQGGIGADSADLSPADEALRQEGVLDESTADQPDSK